MQWGSEKKSMLHTKAGWGDEMFDRTMKRIQWFVQKWEDNDEY